MTSSTPVRDASATTASAVFGALARLRRRKPLHPRGLVVRAHLVRHGVTGDGGPLGAAFLDEPGSDAGIARISRSAGLPDGWPDVWGLALRLDAVGEDAQAASGVADLLLAGSFAGSATRHALALRRGLQAPLTCVLPYRTTTGRSVMIGAPGPSEQLPSRRDELAAYLTAHTATFTLAVAEPRGAWRPFGTLSVGGAALGSGDGHDEPEDVSFEPVLNPLPGLALPEPLATVRSRAYAGARDGRGADPATVHRLPARQ